MSELNLDPSSTALVLIDLQKGIVSGEAKPHPSGLVVENASKVADALRALGGTVVLVHVGFKDAKEQLAPNVDQPNPAGLPGPDWYKIVPELGPKEGDVVVFKRQWGAFYGTDLELQLRRRGIKTILLGGIATNFGVESTARDAWERGFEQIFIEDATSSRSAEGHEFTFKTIFPRLGRVRKTEEVVKALAPSG